MAKSKIKWTDDTWNPIVGCSIVSPGCTNCYAMRMAARLERMGNSPQYNGMTKKVNGKVVWTGKVALAEKALLKPLKRQKPTTYFVNSMGDLFHEDVPDDWINQVFAVMALCPQHTFQVLTKRADRMREYMKKAFDRVVIRMLGLTSEGWPTIQAACSAHGIPWEKPRSGDDWWPLRNVWLGVSAEDQRRANERIPLLLDTPAAVRFVSCEPLLSPVDLISITLDVDSELDALNVRLWEDEVNDWESTDDDWQEAFEDWYGQAPLGLTGPMTPVIDWVIVGGESGLNARPMHPDWARDLRDQCNAAGTAFFFKQWGEWQPVSEMGGDKIEALHHPAPVSRPDANQRGKHDSICLDLDGTTYSLGTAGKLACCPAGAFAGPKPMSMFRVGKASAGRLLDGREWNGVPG